MGVSWGCSLQMMLGVQFQTHWLVGEFISWWLYDGGPHCLLAISWGPLLVPTGYPQVPVVWPLFVTWELTSPRNQATTCCCCCLSFWLHLKIPLIISAHPRESPFWLTQSLLIRDLNCLCRISSSFLCNVTLSWEWCPLVLISSAYTQSGVRGGDYTEHASMGQKSWGPSQNSAHLTYVGKTQLCIKQALVTHTFSERARK